MLPTRPEQPAMSGSSGCSENYELFKTSLTYQTKQFFHNSTLHGVRYIREEGRPFCEKFMWFCFTTIGGVATLIIIVSLWEKFQTNPTITGLDTDFHNWDVPFPAVSMCLTNPADEEEVDKYVKEEYGDKGTNDTKKAVKEFLMQMTNFSYGNLAAFKPLLNVSDALINSKPLPDLQKMFVKKCETLMLKCEFRAQSLDTRECCDKFKPLPTEIGFCYAFNARHAYMDKKDGEFNVEFIYERDEKWSLSVTLSNPDELSKRKADISMIRIYIHSHDEVPILDVSPQHEWNFNIPKLAFSAKQTYTTEDARQLSIKQRHCVFGDEIKLDTDSIYTYGACMSQCRMRLARKLCNCVPFFYKTIEGYTVCTVKDLKCLVENADKLLNERARCRCDLGCMNTVYEVEKLRDTGTIGTIEMSFVSWPIIRYKREVLFGWVDLLVSFGGIAGLFLGFSLLSGVEIVYYFTLRACCMVVRNKDELKRLEEEYANAEKPPLDLSLTPYFLKGAGGAGGGLTQVKPQQKQQEQRQMSQLRVPRESYGGMKPPYAFEFLP